MHSVCRVASHIQSFGMASLAYIANKVPPNSIMSSVQLKHPTILIRRNTYANTFGYNVVQMWNVILNFAMQ